MNFLPHLLMDFNFEAMDLSRLYRASDARYKHREAMQEMSRGTRCCTAIHWRATNGPRY